LLRGVLRSPALCIRRKLLLGRIAMHTRRDQPL